MGDQRRIQTVRNVCRQVDCGRPAASSTQQQQLYGWERDNVIYILPTLVVNPILCWCNNIYCHPALESHQLRWLAFNRIILKTIRRVTSATNGNVCRGVYSRHIIHCARNGDFCPAELHHISHLYAMVSSPVDMRFIPTSHATLGAYYYTFYRHRVQMQLGRRARN